MVNGLAYFGKNGDLFRKGSSDIDTADVMQQLYDEILGMSSENDTAAVTTFQNNAQLNAQVVQLAMKAIMASSARAATDNVTASIQQGLQVVRFTLQHTPQLLSEIAEVEEEEEEAEGRKANKKKISTWLLGRLCYLVGCPGLDTLRGQIMGNVELLLEMSLESPLSRIGYDVVLMRLFEISNATSAYFKNQTQDSELHGEIHAVRCALHVIQKLILYIRLCMEHGLNIRLDNTLLRLEDVCEHFRTNVVYLFSYGRPDDFAEEICAYFSMELLALGKIMTRAHRQRLYNMYRRSLEKPLYNIAPQDLLISVEAGLRQRNLSAKDATMLSWPEANIVEVAKDGGLIQLNEENLVHLLYTSLELRKENNAIELTVHMARLEEVSNEPREVFISRLGRLFCKSHGSQCERCDGSARSSSSAILNPTSQRLLISILLKIFKMSAVREREITLNTALHAIEHMLKHIYLDIGSGQQTLRDLAGYMLQLLSHTSRAIRLKAGIVVGLLYEAVIDVETSNKASLHILPTLQKLLSRSNDEYTDTVLMTLVRIGLTAKRDDLSIILQTLVGILGHSNLYLSSLADQMIQSLSKHKGISTWHLMSPFWHVIAVAVVLELPVRHQVLNSLCGLLGIQESDFLNRTADRIMPEVVLSGDIKLMEIVSKKSSIDVAVLLTNHMASILCQIFARCPGDLQAQAASLFSKFRPGFVNVGIHAMVRSVAPELVGMLLQVIHQVPLGNRERVRCT